MDRSEMRVGSHCLVAADDFIETYRTIKQNYGHQIAAVGGHHYFLCCAT